jgi:hypothetical protein
MVMIKSLAWKRRKRKKAQGKGDIHMSFYVLVIETLFYSK